MGSRPRLWPEEIRWCLGGSGSEGVALAIWGAPCGILPESEGLLRLFGWSRRSWSRPPPSPWWHTPPASLSAAVGTAGRCLLTVMWRTSMTGRRGPEPPCHSSPLRLLRPPRPSGHGRGGRRPGDRACRLHLALECGHQLALMVISYLNHQAGKRPGPVGGGMLEVCSGRERRWRARFDAHEGLQLGAATAPPTELFNAAAGAYLDDNDERASAKGKTDVQYIILDRVQPSAASSGGACWMSSRRPWSGGASRKKARRDDGKESVRAGRPLLPNDFIRTRRLSHRTPRCPRPNVRSLSTCKNAGMRPERADLVTENRGDRENQQRKQQRPPRSATVHDPTHRRFARNNTIRGR
ncbi:hypothetical protein CFC21_060996 [Triticum aestivum]|uniref:Uncharacterized protein n=2 Tax=Triticum aestivum TaxID=4565 RepID=A0A9R1GU94_WHEAT|nr:uncharacterized protein LOC123096349 isoform X1 [Triticum aestivum]KAF7052988.1 hypothetical protein CFC21_060996 [Triticum aestivum]